MHVVTVRFYAAAAEAAGTHETTIEVPDDATVDDALQLVDSRYPKVAAMRSQCSVFVDDVQARTPQLGNARTLDILPPFAGG